LKVYHDARIAHWVGWNKSPMQGEPTSLGGSRSTPWNLN
jgi:hypothetical protein